MTVAELAPDLGDVSWDWADGMYGGRAIYHAQTPKQTIYAITLAFPQQISLREVIQAYGEPSHVIAVANHNPDSNSGISYSLLLVYLSHGFVLGPEGFGKPQLSIDMPLLAPTFFAPTEEGLATLFNEAGTNSEWLQPWQGLKDFDFYCRAPDGSNACQAK
jgi:hypothetical protein